MKTTSTLYKETNFKGSISINTLLSKRPTNHLKIENNFKKLNSSGEKAIIINMFPNQVINKKSDTSFTYILKQGDDKRLNKNGILRVYDMNEAINIPVEKLLGKWKNTHVGVTLVASNEKWSLKDGNENLTIKHEPLLQTAFQRFLRFVVA